MNRTQPIHNPEADYDAMADANNARVDTHPYYDHRSMTAILDALLEAGFAIEKALEPQPVPAMQASHPELYEKLMHYPWFLVIRARWV